MTHTTEELQAMLAALDGALPLLRHDTQDYAEISGPCLQAMTTAPDAVMLLNDVPALLTELLASREALRVAEEAGRHIMPYLKWTISDESCGHHPTMPSAVAAFEGALTAIRSART